MSGMDPAPGPSRASSSSSATVVASLPTPPTQGADPATPVSEMGNPPLKTRPMPPALAPVVRPGLSRRTTGEDPGPSDLQRTSSRTFIQHALRRMATHETGEGVETGYDGNALDTHDEHEHEHEHEHGHEHGRRSSKASGLSSGSGHAGSDEELAVGLTSHNREQANGDADNGKDPAKSSKSRKKDVELQDQTNLLPIRQVMMVFCGLTAALFCSLLDQTIVTTALPTLGRVFQRADIASWVGTAYLLTSTAMQPIYGRLSDIFGRKFILLASLCIFLLGSLACAVAQSMIQLIIFRAIQGIGGGGILTLSMIIVSDVVSLKDRGKYQGIIGVVVALSNSLGPILGGVFTERVTWRWCFYINLPLSSMSILIIIFLLPLRRVKGDVKSKLRKLDVWGSLLTLAWAVGILLALSWAGSQYAWDSPAVLVPLFLGLALLGVFLYVEARLIPLPLIPMQIFKIQTVWSAMLTTFLSGCVFYSTLYYLPTYFQVVRGATPIHAGVLMLPLVLVQTVCAFTSGILVSKTGDYYWNLLIGFMLWTVGLGLMGSTNEYSSTATIAGYQVIIGIGAGQTFQTSLIAIQASVERKDMATATGTRNALRMLGGTVALAACTSIVSNVVRSRLSGLGFSEDIIRYVLSDPTTLGEIDLTAAQKTEVISAYAKGISSCFYFMTPLAGISVFLTLFFIKRIPLNRGDEKAKKEEAKAWVESKRAKKQAKRSGSHGARDQGAPVAEKDAEKDGRGANSALKATSEQRGHDHHPGVVEEIERELEIAGRGEAEASGVDPPKNQQ